jgi:hypothetical protein
MTGYTVHTGSTEKFSTGWDRIFQGKKKAAGKSKSSAAKGAAKAPKSAAKKRKKSK